VINFWDAHFADEPREGTGSLTAARHVLEDTSYQTRANYTFLDPKGHSAQPEIFWRANQTEPDPTSMRVMHISLV
jgi:hypothetical protein